MTDGKAADSVGSSLCIQCGLCCTGALHNYAVLDPDETVFARSLGLVLRTEGRPGFALPCPRLRGSMCSIYSNRPNVCSRYKCRLLESVEGGSSSLESALAIVKEARRLARSAEELLPDDMALPEARAITFGSSRKEADLNQRDLALPAQLGIVALCLYIDKHFKNDREGKLLSLRPASDTTTKDMEMK